MFQACIFDLDGVVTDTAHYHFLAWRALASSLGIEFTEEDNDKLKGVGRMESLGYILAKSSCVFSGIARDALASEKNEHYMKLINGITPDALLPGITDAFVWLKDNGVAIGLASASRNAPQVIASLGIANIFDYVADAGAIPNGKPAPDIFLDVAKALSVKPEYCLGIEDAVAGVAAIKAADMYAIGIGDPSILTEADEVMPTPEGLAHSLAKLY